MIGLTGTFACQVEDFENSYSAPGKLEEASVGKMFSGFVYSNMEYVVPDYWNYFVVLRPTVQRWNQAVGWINEPGQYVPGSSTVGDRWGAYYNFLAQYREFQKTFGRISAEKQADNRIYEMAAAIYFYDQTQKTVDLHGDIPWSEAGGVNTTGGDYLNSYPAYDKAEDIYTAMLDDLKAMADEFKTLDVPAGVMTDFTVQDLVNHGSVEDWQRYCNSLRLRLLTRVKDVPAFSSRYSSEISAMLASPADYPLVMENSQNVQINIYDNTSDISADRFEGGLEDWNGNLAGKAMMDHMNANLDPRQRAMFEPGENAGGVYIGMDPLMVSSDQQVEFDAGNIAFYNRTTLSRNDNFPGILINAAQVHFMLAEYYIGMDNAMAKNYYDGGIERSIDQYYLLNSISNDNIAGTLTPTNAAEISAYQTAVDFAGAASDAERLELLSYQRWIHFSVVQPLELWSEIRRTGYPVLTFQADNTNAQTLPPYRWNYASDEPSLNGDNYAAVAAEDNLSTKLFWDLN